MRRDETELTEEDVSLRARCLCGGVCVFHLSAASTPNTKRPCLSRNTPPPPPRSYGKDLSHALASIIGDISERAMLLLIPVPETALCRFPKEATTILDELLLRLFAEAVGGRESDLVVAHCCACLGRALLQAPEEFYALVLRGAAAGAVPGGADPLLAFLDAWTDRADCLTNADRRKARAARGIWAVGG